MCVRAHRLQPCARLRKGTKEKTVGPYSETLWDSIVSLVASKLDLGINRNDYDEAARVLAVSRAKQMSENCVYAVDEYCQFWGMRIPE